MTMMQIASNTAEAPTQPESPLMKLLKTRSQTSGKLASMWPSNWTTVGSPRSWVTCTSAASARATALPATTTVVISAKATIKNNAKRIAVQTAMERLRAVAVAALGPEAREEDHGDHKEVGQYVKQAEVHRILKYLHLLAALEAVDLRSHTLHLGQHGAPSLVYAAENGVACGARHNVIEPGKVGSDVSEPPGGLPEHPGPEVLVIRHAQDGAQRMPKGIDNRLPLGAGVAGAGHGDGLVGGTGRACGHIAPRQRGGRAVLDEAGILLQVVKPEQLAKACRDVLWQVLQRRQDPGHGDVVDHDTCDDQQPAHQEEGSGDRSPYHHWEAEPRGDGHL
eukprot:CAMPEP_0175746978 /NCGR_PEP_ID=MMETSP0097-20121207/58862_1 /TAXON_ID=311494 /ORGANISM="Alexandrium monilatum, Strain CCMP3105" /LENGTH=335 /DNA_ID=CAMNT_0017055417 /DNA_START=408 /DNA_END=1412 /DNA_ORIENTATION=-